MKYLIIYTKLIVEYEIFLSTFDFIIPYLKQRVKYLIENNQNEIIYPNKINRYKHKYSNIKKFLSDRKKNSLINSYLC